MVGGMREARERHRYVETAPLVQHRQCVRARKIQPNALVAFDTKSRRWVASVPVGAKAPNTVRHMTFDKKTRQLWFGADQNFIGSAKVPGPGIVP